MYYVGVRVHVLKFAVGVYVSRVVLHVRDWIKIENKSWTYMFHTDFVLWIIMSHKHSPGPTPDIIHPAHSTKKVGYVSHMRYFYGLEQLIYVIIDFLLK
jgi:hypothetical protein